MPRSFPTMQSLPILGAVLFLIPLTACRAEPTAAEWAEEKVRKMGAAGPAGVAALVARDGMILWQGAVGFADAAKSTAPLPFTKEKEGMVSHVESDTGSQVQPAEPWTLKRPVVARATT